MLDGTVKSLYVDDSQTVGNLMVLICTKIGITNHDEYSLVWDKPEDEQENIPTNRFDTLRGTMTIRSKKFKEGEKEIDPKMVELKKQLNTEDGGKHNLILFFNHFQHILILIFITDYTHNDIFYSKLGRPQ